MKAKTRITKKTLGWIAAAFLLAGMFSACKEAVGLIGVEDMQPEKKNNGGRYTVSTSITPEGGGTFTATPNSNLAEGATVNLEITPAGRYRFVGLTVTGWTGIMTGSGPIYTFEMPAANVVLGAVFEAGEGAESPGTLHRVTIEQAAGGAINANLDYALAGASVTLTATPDIYYTLVSGPTVTKESSGDVTVSGSGLYTFKMPEEGVTVSAEFEAVGVSTTIPINAPASVSPSGWTYSSSTVTITGNGDYTITGSTTTNRVVVDNSVTANITLNGVSIDVSGETNACAFDVKPNATANLILAKGTTNTLKSNGTSAGLQVPTGATLTITSAAGAGRTSGTLNAYGGLGSGQHSGAGIGGGQAQSGGNITILGGTVNAYGFDDETTDGIHNLGAGIGGGGFDTNAGTPKAGDGGNITISGGAVTAKGGSSKTSKGEGAAGIGGGSGDFKVSNSGGTGGTITITGGTVTASTRINGAGIGGGHFGAGGGTINISGGVVTATGGYVGAGIGGGHSGGGGTINISGGAVTATGGYVGAGIGGSQYGAGGGTINITGGAVTTMGGQYSAGIGSAYNGGAAGIITINGAVQVNATGGDRCPGIGSGCNAGSGSANNISIFGITYTGNGNTGTGNGAGASSPKTITINGSGGSKVISTAGLDGTKCAIGEGYY